MLLRSLRVGWRQLLADPGTTAVVVLGLAVAIACTCLIGQAVADAVLPDPKLPEPDRVVRLEFHANIPGQPDDWYPLAPFVFAQALRSAGAPIGAIARSSADDDGALRVGDRLLHATIVYSEPALVDVFGLRAERGDLREALRRPDALALTRAMAGRLFGSLDPMGRQVSVLGHAMTVVAVMPDPSPRGTFRSEVFASLKSPGGDPGREGLESWTMMAGRVHARLAPGHSAAELGALAQALFDRGPAASTMPPEFSAGGRRVGFVRAVPLAHAALDGAGGAATRGFLCGLVGAGAMVLVLALANVVNLTTVRTLRRQREIAVCKSLGAGTAQLVAQFVVEATLLAAISGALGLLLAWLMAPVAVALLGAPGTQVAFELSPGFVAALVAGVLALGAVGGLVPARVALGVRCAESLAGRPHDEGRAGQRVRRALTALQFAIAIVLCADAGAVLWQNHHVAGLDRGFRTAGLLTIDFPELITVDAANRLRDALAREPAVQATAWSGRTPADHPTGSVAGWTFGDRRVTSRLSMVDPGFFAVYDIPFLAGAPVLTSTPAHPNVPGAGWVGPPRDADDIRPVVIDELAVRAFGFASPQAALGATLRGVGEFGENEPHAHRVVGVVPRLRQEDARNPAQPQVIGLSGGPLRTLTLRGTDMAAMQRAAAAAWPRYFPNELPDLESFEARLARAYADDRRVAALAVAAGTLALLLGGCGVYALAAWSVRRSARQIVIRKLHGAGRADIAAFVARQFLPLLLVAIVVGLPLAGWLAQAWLANFVERSDAAFWSLPLAVLAVVAMTALAALRHTVAAMNLRPAAVLKE